MQCIKGFVSQQPDELSLDKADVILVHQEIRNQESGDSKWHHAFSIIPMQKCITHLDFKACISLKKAHTFPFFFPDWVEGTRLSDRHRGWVPISHLETISNSRVRQRNLADALKLTTATAAVWAGWNGTKRCPLCIAKTYICLVEIRHSVTFLYWTVCRLSAKKMLHWWFSPVSLSETIHYCRATHQLLLPQRHNVYYCQYVTDFAYINGLVFEKKILK